MIRRLCVLMFLLFLPLSGWAQQQLPIPPFQGPWLPAETENNVNTLIRTLNAIFTPLFPPVPGAVNFPILTGAPSGGITTISTGGAGADPNASIGINPNGNGNIILFAGAPGDTGLVQFANLASFVAAPSLTACSSGPPLAAIQGVHSTVQGYLLFKDWLGFTRGSQVC